MDIDVDEIGGTVSVVPFPVGKRVELGRDVVGPSGVVTFAVEVTGGRTVDVTGGRVLDSVPFV